MTTINGRTPEEIKKGLECCKPKWESSRWVTCRDECPFRNEHAFCKNVLMACTLALLYRLERERDELLQKNQQLERERDAAVEEIFKTCSNCKHEKLGYGVGPCPPVEEYIKISDCSNWQWRGV